MSVLLDAGGRTAECGPVGLFHMGSRRCVTVSGGTGESAGGQWIEPIGSSDLNSEVLTNELRNPSPVSTASDLVNLV